MCIDPLCASGMYAFMCVRVHNEERARAVCQPRGCFLSPARRRSHHWTDGQHPPSLLPYPFIYSSFSPSITVFLSCVPPNTTSPQSLVPHLPASPHPYFPSYCCHNKSECCAWFTFPSRSLTGVLLHPNLVSQTKIITARGKTPCKCTCSYTLMLTWLLSFDGQTFSTRLTLKLRARNSNI